MTPRTLLRILAGTLAGFVLALSAQAAGHAPALVLVLMLDGLPQEQLVKYRDLYGPGGFRRLLEDGAWYGMAQQAHAATLTAPGHAAVLTGTYPYRNGIIANEWTDRRTLGQVYCTGDPAHTYIGEETKKLDGTSPANLKVSTLGDELRYSNGGRSKVLAVSGKDRGAILLAGKQGTAYMYMDRSGRFASSTYYMKEHPKWHADYYAGKPQDRWLGRAWEPLLATGAYARSQVEAQPWFRSFAGMGNRLPFALPKEPGRPYYAALMRTPFGDEATLDFARAAVEGENLGRNPAGVPDILGVSLSTHDYVNHGFGPESQASQDHLLRVDQALAAFFEFLDHRVGLDNVLTVFTSDHGFMNAPEYSAGAGLAAARLNHVRMLSDLNEHLSRRFGPGNHVARLSYPTLILDQGLIEKKQLSRPDVESAAARFLADFPGIAAVYTRSQLENGAAPANPLTTLVQRAWHRQLSGDLYIVQDPYTMFGSQVVTHGSPYLYDRHVPIAFLGRRWVKPGKYPQEAAVVDIAPTLAFLLETRAPAWSEGRVLAEILR